MMRLLVGALSENPWSFFDPDGLERLSKDAPSDEAIEKDISRTKNRIGKLWASYHSIGAKKTGSVRGKVAAMDQKRGEIGKLSARNSFLQAVLDTRKEIGEDGYGSNIRAWGAMNRNFGLGQTTPSESLLEWFKPEGGYKTTPAMRSMFRFTDDAAKVSVTVSSFMMGGPPVGKLTSAGEGSAFPSQVICGWLKS